MCVLGRAMKCFLAQSRGEGDCPPPPVDPPLCPLLVFYRNRCMICSRSNGMAISRGSQETVEVLGPCLLGTGHT